MGISKKDAFAYYAKVLGTQSRIDQHEDDASRCMGSTLMDENALKGLDPVLDEMVDKVKETFRDGYLGRAAIARYLKSKLEK